MRPRLARTAAAALAFALLVPFALRAEDAARTKCFLWRATAPASDGKPAVPVYLLGSVHIGEKSLYPLDPAIDAAFAAADALVVEVDMSKVEPDQLNVLMLEKGSYPAGESLGDNLSGKTRRVLEPFLARRGMSIAQVDRLRPWLLSVLLTMQEMTRLGYRADLSIDKHFLDRAKKAKLPVLELETVAQQLEVLAGNAAEVQDLDLRVTIERFSRGKEFADSMFSAWKRGDGKKLDEVIRAPLKENPELAPAMKALFDDRNVQMAAKIAGYLESSKRYFVVAGAGHMVGEKGIVPLLRRKGFRVEQVDAERPVAAPEKERTGKEKAGADAGGE